MHCLWQEATAGMITKVLAHMEQLGYSYICCLSHKCMQRWLTGSGPLWFEQLGIIRTIRNSCSYSSTKKPRCILAPIKFNLVSVSGFGSFRKKNPSDESVVDSARIAHWGSGLAHFNASEDASRCANFSVFDGDDLSSEGLPFASACLLRDSEACIQWFAFNGVIWKPA